MQIALIRLDKIGDLVCTLPVDQIPALAHHDCRWVISQGLGFVAANAVPGRRFIQLDRSRPWSAFRQLVKFLRSEKFKLAVSFQCPWWVNFALWWTDIPVRAGVLSQWHSFLFLNRGLRQKRSRADRHEADYNRELVEYALEKSGLPVQATSTPVLRLRAPQLPEVMSRLGLANSPYGVVHPGMSGSALNWPADHYVKLIRRLVDEIPVVITGTPADEEWLATIRPALAGESRVRWLVGELTSAELLGVLEHARFVVAPSTGVAHLAAALGRPVLSFFSPLRVQRPTRWAPRGDHVKVLMPNAHDVTPDPNCMSEITPEAAWTQLGEWLP